MEGTLASYRLEIIMQKAHIASLHPVSAYHIKLLMLGQEGREGEGGEAAGDEGDVGVDDTAVLVIPCGGARVEGRPVQPQENGT